MKKKRNPVARSPILGKGGRHEKSKSSVRQRAKEELRSQIEQAEAGGKTNGK